MNIPEFGIFPTLIETVRIGKYAVKVYEDSGDVRFQARGFSMLFPEKPNSPWRVLKRNAGPASSLLDQEETLLELTQLGEKWKNFVHARIRADWGQKCLAPDQDGNWHHPLFSQKGRQFSCAHCEQTFPGAAVAGNLWHCPAPDCTGSPIDIH
jgi:hypothetical protein